MSKVPQSLAAGLSDRESSDVSSWWRSLTSAQRRRLRGVTPRRTRKAARFIPLIARFVDPKPTRDRFDDGTTDYYEYLVNHEISLQERTFHICTAHPEARAAIRAGWIGAQFVCPLMSATCPMRSLLALAPGCDLELTRRLPDSPRAAHER